MDIFKSILVYTFCWLISYLLAKWTYNIQIKKVKTIGFSNKNSITYEKKMPYYLIIIISAIFTFYCYYSMAPEDSMAADRQNYTMNFSGNRESPSMGLTAIMGFVLLNGGDFKQLLYISTFSSIFITLIAYRKSKDATPQALLLLFLSQYVLTTLTALKQCYASAFATLAIVLMIQKRNILKDLIIITLILLAILFHPVGYVLLPVYFIMRYFDNKKRNVNQMILVLLFFSIAFIPIMQILIFLLSSFLPSLSGKIDQYFGSDGMEDTESSFFVFLKALPIYIITYYGLAKRNRIKKTIEFYDHYMIICIICSFICLMSLYNVWMLRFMNLFQFVIYIFFVCYLNKIAPLNAKRLFILVALTQLVLTYRFLYITGGYF